MNQTYPQAAPSQSMETSFLLQWGAGTFLCLSSCLRGPSASTSMKRNLSTHICCSESSCLEGLVGESNSNTVADLGLPACSIVPVYVPKGADQATPVNTGATYWNIDLFLIYFISDPDWKIPFIYFNILAQSYITKLRVFCLQEFLINAFNPQVPPAVN